MVMICGDIDEGHERGQKKFSYTLRYHEAVVAKQLLGWGPRHLAGGLIKSQCSELGVKETFSVAVNTCQCLVKGSARPHKARARSLRLASWPAARISHLLPGRGAGGPQEAPQSWGRDGLLVPVHSHACRVLLPAPERLPTH